MRTFEDVPATRKAIPLLTGIFGTTGAGKTLSALRLAIGIQRVTGGEIMAVDTEAGRMLAYADDFKKSDGTPGFRHVNFSPPHGSLDYLGALEHATKRGASIVIFDSASHEHEGIGGVLEEHDKEARRLAERWGTSIEKAGMSAWNHAKAPRRKFINAFLQSRLNLIFCFRAKDKLRLEKGKDPESKGFMPIAGDELAYEMVLNALLKPGARGVPTWESDKEGENQMIKVPKQFLELTASTRGKPLDEDFGEALAKWAAGGEMTRAAEIRAAIRAAETQADLDVVGKEIAEAKDKRTVSPAEFKALRELWAARRDELSPPEPGSHG